MKLLSVNADAKTKKGTKAGYLTGIMYLAPYDVAGANLCAMSELAACRKTCLFVQGRARMSKEYFTAPNGLEYRDTNIIRARIRKTEWFMNDRESFLAQLVKDISAVVRKAKRENMIPTIRLNGTSDIRWENVRFESTGKTIFEVFPDVQFYDYTKIPNRKNLPSNYHLSWSYSEANQKYADMRPEHLNWVVVFRDELPETFLGRKVIDGDETDLRFLDDDGIVVGLKAKGTAKQDTSGFVVDTNQIELRLIA
jgi:hypothetical protein